MGFNDRIQISVGAGRPSACIPATKPERSSFSASRRIAMADEMPDSSGVRTGRGLFRFSGHLSDECSPRNQIERGIIQRRDLSGRHMALNHHLPRGDNVQATIDSSSVERHPADTGTCPKPTDPQSSRSGLRWSAGPDRGTALPIGRADDAGTVERLAVGAREYKIGWRLPGPAFGSGRRAC